MTRIMTALEAARSLKLAMSEGEAYGNWSVLGSPLAIEMVCAAGTAFIGIDAQHGLPPAAALHDLVRAADVWRVPTLVRVPWRTEESIMHALDAGAAGVIVPMVNNEAEARETVNAARFPPLGQRSWGPTRASLGDDLYSPSTANADSLVFAMIETAEAASNVNAIAGIDGIDGLFVGPFDLNVSLTGGSAAASIPSPLFEPIVASVIHATSGKGKFAGYFCPDADTARSRAAQGFQLLPVSTDAALLKRATMSELNDAKESAPEGQLPPRATTYI